MAGVTRSPPHQQIWRVADHIRACREIPYVCDTLSTCSKSLNYCGEAEFSEEIGMNAALQGRVQQVIDGLVESGDEIGLQVAAYVNGELVVDTWSGVVDEDTGQL